MKVVFRQNLGSSDAKTLGLDYKKCTIGDSADVSTEIADKLKKSGVAVAADEADDDELITSHSEEQDRLAALRKKPDVKAVAEKPAITAPLKTSDKQ